MSFAKILEKDGSLTYQLPGNVVFQQPPLAEHEYTSRPVLYAEEAMKWLADTIEFTDQMANDPELSVLGQQRKVEPKQGQMFETIANRWGALDNEEKELDASEERMLAVPALDPSHSAMAIEDREIRDWLRSQPTDVVAQVVRGNERLEIAILRSPVPQTDLLVRLALESWNDHRRAINPAETVRIEAARQNIDWARRALSQVAGLTQVKFRNWNGDRIMRQIVNSPNHVTAAGARAFGESFDEKAVARTKRAIEIEKLTGR